jgi:PhnB protein
MYVYVRDVDAFAKKAESERCTIVRPPHTQFYSDRSVAIKDPFGYTWGFATHVEDVPPEEIQNGAAQMFGKKQ